MWEVLHFFNTHFYRASDVLIVHVAWREEWQYVRKIVTLSLKHSDIFRSQSTIDTPMLITKTLVSIINKLFQESKDTFNYISFLKYISLTFVKSHVPLLKVVSNPSHMLGAGQTEGSRLCGKALPSVTIGTDSPGTKATTWSLDRDGNDKGGGLRNRTTQAQDHQAVCLHEKKNKTLISA